MKKQFDRRIYDLDTFKSILCKINDFDYRYASNKYDDFEKSQNTTASANTISETDQLDGHDPDEMSPGEVRQLELILNKRCKKC